jgi:hypothetical protein
VICKKINTEDLQILGWNSMKLPAAAWMLLRPPMPVRFWASCRTKRETVALKVGVRPGTHILISYVLNCLKTREKGRSWPQSGSKLHRRTRRNLCSSEDGLCSEPLAAYVSQGHVSVALKRSLVR